MRSAVLALLALQAESAWVSRVSRAHSVAEVSARVDYKTPHNKGKICRADSDCNGPDKGKCVEEGSVQRCVCYEAKEDGKFYYWTGPTCKEKVSHGVVGALLVVAIVLPILALCGLCAIIWCCCCRNK